VEVSVGGRPWRSATLTGGHYRHGWRAWQLRARVTGPGPFIVRARATDAAGRTQPGRPAWNPLGYAANPVHQVVISVCCAPAEAHTGTTAPGGAWGDPAPVRRRRHRAPHSHTRAGLAGGSPRQRATAGSRARRTPRPRPSGPPSAGR